MDRIRRICGGKGFTLIERVSRLILGRCSLLKCRPYQFPARVGSLTTRLGKQFLSLMRSDKVSEGKPFAPIDESSCVQRNHHKEIKGKATLNPTYWQGKEADRSPVLNTGRVGVVKVRPGRIVDCLVTVRGDLSFYRGSLLSLGK